MLFYETTIEFKIDKVNFMVGHPGREMEKTPLPERPLRRETIDWVSPETGEVRQIPEEVAERLGEQKRQMEELKQRLDDSETERERLAQENEVLRRQLKEGLTGILKDALEAIPETEREPEMVSERGQETKESDEAFLRKTVPGVVSLRARLGNSFAAMTGVLGKDILPEWENAEDERQRMTIIGAVRRELAKLIKEGEIDDPSDIFPWLPFTNSKKKKPKINYRETLKDLRRRGARRQLEKMAQRGNERAGITLTNLDEVIKRDRILSVILGPRVYTDKLSGKTRPGILWQAIEEAKEKTGTARVEGKKTEKKDRGKGGGSGRKTVASGPKRQNTGNRPARGGYQIGTIIRAKGGEPPSVRR